MVRLRTGTIPILVACGAHRVEVARVQVQTHVRSFKENRAYADFSAQLRPLRRIRLGLNLNMRQCRGANHDGGCGQRLEAFMAVHVVPTEPRESRLAVRLNGDLDVRVHVPESIYSDQSHLVNGNICPE